MDKMNRKSKLKLSRETMTRLSGSGKKGGGWRVLVFPV